MVGIPTMELSSPMLDQSVSETLDVDRRRSTEFLLGATDERSRPQWAASFFRKNGAARPLIQRIGLKFDANALSRSNSSRIILHLAAAFWSSTAKPQLLDVGGGLGFISAVQPLLSTQCREPS